MGARMPGERFYWLPGIPVEWGYLAQRTGIALGFLRGGCRMGIWHPVDSPKRSGVMQVAVMQVAVMQVAVMQVAVMQVAVMQVAGRVNVSGGVFFGVATRREPAGSGLPVWR